MTNDTNNNENINENPEISQKEQILEDKKQQLLQEKEMQENEIFDKIASIKSEAIEKFKIVASIGSVAVGAYLVLKYFFGKKDFTLSELMPSVFSGDGNNKEENLEPEGKSSENFGLNPKHSKEYLDENSILATFKREIALFLVSIAKQKILEFLAYLQDKNTEDANFEEEK